MNSKFSHVKLLLTVLVLFFNNCIYAQETCEVSVAALKGTYTGDCSGNKANGHGKATGINTYEGDFKNGYPDGNGTYTWENGDFFVGTFKKNMKNGAGEYHFHQINLPDSVVKGFWQKDKYIGQYLKPFIVHYKSVGVSRTDVKEDIGEQRTIRIISEPVAKTQGMKLVQPQPITQMAISNGSYTHDFKTESLKESITTLKGVVFPFRAIISFGQSSVEIEFLKESSYTVSVMIDPQQY